MNHLLTVGGLRDVIKGLPDTTNVIIRSGNGKNCKSANVHVFPARYSWKTWDWELIMEQDGEVIPDKSKMEFYVLSFD